MAAPTFLVLFCASLLLTTARGNNLPPPQDPQFSLAAELDQIKSRISFLESTLDERTRELTSKDESIIQLEKNVNSKSVGIASLQLELDALQQQSSLDAKYEAVKAHIRASELAKQVEALQKDIKMLFKKKDALESQANQAEKKVQKLSSNLEKLQKINDELKIKILKTERALRLAEEEIMKARLEVTYLPKKPKMDYGVSLPPLIAVPLADLQSYIMTHLYPQGRSAFGLISQEISDKMVQAWIWLQPHMETARTKGIPVLKEWWWKFLTYLEPHVQRLTTRSVEAFDASKHIIGQHAVNVQKLADPYIQEAKKLTESYKPHVDNVWAALKTFAKILLRLCEKIMKSVVIYHRQVQAGALKFLQSYEFTEPYASNQIAWFAASSLFALPVIYLCSLPSAISGKKRKRHSRHSNTHQTRRRLKRTYQDG